MTGFEPEPLSFQVERTTQWTTRATRTELASFSKHYYILQCIEYGKQRQSDRSNTTWAP